MLNPDADDITDLKSQFPNGRASNDEIECMALRRALNREIPEVADERIRDILETIVYLL